MYSIALRLKRKMTRQEFENSKEKLKHEFFNQFYEKDKIEKDKLEEGYTNFEESLDPRYDHLLTLYDPGDDSNLEIDVAIFLALLNKDKKNKEMDLISIKNQLKLAMDFNRIDIAKKFIFVEDISNIVIIKYNV
jgi:hypothetical protein